MKAVADPGDEVIYSLPPWFAYEALLVEAGLVPVKVRIDLETLDLDVDAIAAAITPRTRIVIVNTPNNPTGRVYSAETLTRLATVLEEASARNGRRIFLLSDEPYNRIVFSGVQFRTPAEFYPHTLVAYSYGKTLLSPGQRIGYLALPPALPDREALRRAVHDLQIAIGWAFPNAVMQYALPELEQQAFDVARLERRRDQMVDALTSMGYTVHRPEGTFYLFPRSPIPDDEAFARLLVEQGILVMPGALFETPGFPHLPDGDRGDVRAIPAGVRRGPHAGGHGDVAPPWEAAAPSGNGVQEPCSQSRGVPNAIADSPGYARPFAFTVRAEIEDRDDRLGPDRPRGCQSTQKGSSLLGGRALPVSGPSQGHGRGAPAQH